MSPKSASLRMRKSSRPVVSNRRPWSKRLWRSVPPIDEEPYVIEERIDGCWIGEVVTPADLHLSVDDCHRERTSPFWDRCGRVRLTRGGKLRRSGWGLGPWRELETNRGLGASERVRISAQKAPNSRAHAMAAREIEQVLRRVRFGIEPNGHDVESGSEIT